MSELKPCPFCDSSAKFRRRRNGPYLENFVKCRGCNCRSGVVLVPVLSGDDRVDAAEREAIRVWQRRADHV